MLPPTPSSSSAQISTLPLSSNVKQKSDLAFDVKSVRNIISSDKVRPIFIGDVHNDLSHVARITTLLHDLKDNGTNDLFLEAFYHKDSNMLQPNKELSVDEIGKYLKERNFVHTTTEKGIINLPHLYKSLIDKAHKLGINVHGIDTPLPSSIANLTKGKAFKVIGLRTGGVNDVWKKNINQIMGDNQHFAIFGGRAHSMPLSKRIPNLDAFIFKNNQLTSIDHIRPDNKSKGGVLPSASASSANQTHGSSTNKSPVHQTSENSTSTPPTSQEGASATSRPTTPQKGASATTTNSDDLEQTNSSLPSNFTSIKKSGYSLDQEILNCKHPNELSLQYMQAV